MSVSDLAHEAASRYLAMVPVRQMITDELTAMASKSPLPLEQREARIRQLTDRLLPIVKRIFIHEAVAHFTVGELHALVRFYGSPDGRSVLQKILGFTRDLQRELAAAIEAEIRRPAPSAPGPLAPG